MRSVLARERTAALSATFEGVHSAYYAVRGSWGGSAGTEVVVQREPGVPQDPRNVAGELRRYVHPLGLGGEGACDAQGERGAVICGARVILGRRR